MITFSMLSKYGRLGNQMFQIASTIGIATRHNTAFYFPYWEYNRFFRRELPLLNPELISPRLKLLKEKNTYYHEINLDMKYDWDLLGYFQCDKYFDKDYVDYYFDFDYPLDRLNLTSIHVRRGDYLNLPLHNILPKDYYKRAMELFPSTTNFIIFSDDAEWCKQNFGNGVSLYCDVSSPIESLYMMASCENNIIANSSFSWWAAYLNKNPDKVVVAPKQWVLGEERNDRIVEGWVAI